MWLVKEVKGTSHTDLHNLHDPRDFLAGTILVCLAQYTRESFELLHAGSKEIDMNRGVQKCMETTNFNTDSGRTQGWRVFFFDAET